MPLSRFKTPELTSDSLRGIAVAQKSVSALLKCFHERTIESTFQFDSMIYDISIKGQRSYIEKRWETVVDFTDGGKTQGMPVEKVLQELKKLNFDIADHPQSGS